MRQHAVVSVGQLCGIGISRQSAAARVKDQTLYRVFLGVYSVVPAALLSRHGWWMAATLACGEAAVISHFSAAQLLDIRRGGGKPIHVTITRRSGLAIPGIRVHRPLALPEAHRTTRAGIPCTSLAKTLLDISPSLSREGLEGAFTQAETRRLDFSGLPELIAASNGRRGVVKLRAVAADFGIGLKITKNGLERRMLAICRAARLPEPRVNHWLDLGDGLPMVEIDFYWPELRAAVETDGGGSHGTIRGVERDYARERRLARAGITATRFSEPEVFAHPRRVGGELGEFLARARALQLAQSTNRDLTR